MMNKYFLFISRKIKKKIYIIKKKIIILEYKINYIKIINKSKNKNYNKYNKKISFLSLKLNKIY